MNTKKYAVPAVLTSMISVQGGAAVAKILFQYLGAAGTGTLRIGLSAIILLLVNRPSFGLLTRSQWLSCMAYGICLASMNLLFYFAIQRIPLGLGVTIEFIGPLALAFILSRKVLDILWAGLACMGILLIVPWQSSSDLDGIGLLLAFSAGVMWAGYILLGRRVSQKMNAREAVTIGLCFSTLFILPFGILGGGLYALNLKLFGAGLAVAFLSSAIPYTLDMVALKNIPSKTFSILMSLQPAFGALSGLLFLQEYLTLTQWLSIACVIGASMGATLTNKK